MSQPQALPDRCQARAAFGAAGIRTIDLSQADIRNLRSHLRRAIRASEGLSDRDFRLKGRSCRKRSQKGPVTLIRVQSRWFDDREAFTINPDGFIGIAGWADAENVRPFVDAVVAWSAELAQRRVADAGPVLN